MEAKTIGQSEIDFLAIVEAGHGGIDPDGAYTTKGKQSCKDENGKVVLYEGQENRIKAKMLVDQLKANGIKAINLVESIPNYASWADIPLSKRTDFVNKMCARHKHVILISLHSDGAGDGVNWYPASGVSTFHYTKASKKSKELAKIMQGNLMISVGNLTKDRGVRSKNLHMLRESKCPAVLCELGFHTHKEEALLIQTDEWRKKTLDAMVTSCKQYRDAL